MQLMGAQARAKRARHELLQRERAAVLASPAARLADDPAMQAIQDAHHDAACAALVAAGAPEQEKRLRGRGYRRRYANRDGIGMWDLRNRVRVLHSVSREDDGHVWAHVSVSNPANTMPTWNEVRDAAWLLYPDRHGIIVVAPQSTHVNIANVAHAWYCLTAPSCPDFTSGLGTI